ncbi:hypothetical protein [Emcibacter sp. SYSU 3D8]|uniref:hypothetical protein n=1 Tax=Emcibacter sp. SYSU 3D8 TaxID=3133969 RepID=UPI0031FE5ECA
MTARRGLSGPQFTAHLLFAPLVLLAAWHAWRVSTPDICALMGVYLVAATLLHELLARMGRRRGARLFAGTGKAYATLAGLLAVYIASDAHVLEQASRAYPAGGRWFGLLLGNIAVLGALQLVHRSGRATNGAGPAARHGFASLGLGLFVVLIVLQLLAMTALLPWSLLAVLYRVVFCVAAVWVARLGLVQHSGVIFGWGLAFLWLGLMTAYLDLLWPWRMTLPFLAGAAVLGTALALAMVVQGRKLAAARP